MDQTRSEVARWISLGVVLAVTACSSGAGDATPTGTRATSATTATSATPATPATSVALTIAEEIVPATEHVNGEVHRFPTEVFASLSDESVPAELAAELQALLDESNNGDGGITAAVISRHGTWNGASGYARSWWRPR